MQLYLLVTPNMLPLPSEIKEIEVFKPNLDIVITQGNKPEGIVSGRSCIVEGSEEDIIKWLSPYEGVWLGQGIPQEESFQVYHIKPELIT